MRTLTTPDLLALWERGNPLHPLDRAMLVLAAAVPGVSFDTLADWPLGKRNATLAALRIACFGPRLEGWSTCPQCEEKLEFEIDATLFAQSVDDSSSAPVSVNRHTFRLPTTRDLAGIAGMQDPATAALSLAESCRIGPGQPATAADLGEIGEALAAADPLAEILLAMPCPVCGHEGSASLDLIAFFWAELERRARRLLREVHHLASAYGWTEPQILALSDHRRAAYLEMVHA